MRQLDLSGQRVGRWLVIGKSENRGMITMWLCRCVCGEERTVSTCSLRNGKSLSCGCLRDEKRCEPRPNRVVKHSEEFLRKRKNAYNKKYLRANPAKAKEIRSSAASKASKRRWLERNAERERAKASERRRVKYRQDPAQGRANSLAWRLANPEKAKAIRERSYYSDIAHSRLMGQASEQRRRAVRRSAPGRGVSKEVWLGVCELFDGVCAYCLTAKATSMDHVVPMAKGGAHDVDNIVPACKSCNSRKGVKSILEFAMRGGGVV